MGVTAAVAVFLLLAPQEKGDEPVPRPKLAKTVKISVDVAEMILSPDRAFLYLLDRAGARVLRFDTARRELDSKTAEVPTAARGMTLSPDGKTLYVTPKDAGAVVVLDAATLETRTTFHVNFAVESMTAAVADRLFVVGQKGDTFPTVLMDSARGEPVWEIPRGSKEDEVCLASGYGWLFTNGYAVPIPEAKAISPGLRLPRIDWDRIEGKGPHTLSPDGAWAFSPSGEATRMSKGEPGGYALAGKVIPYSALTMDPGHPELWISDLGGRLHVYSLKNLKSVKSYLLQKRAYRLALDARLQVLYSLADEDPWTTKVAEHLRAPRGGELHIYTVDTLLKAGPKESPK